MNIGRSIEEVLQTHGFGWVLNPTVPSVSELADMDLYCF